MNRWLAIALALLVVGALGCGKKPEATGGIEVSEEERSQAEKAAEPQPGLDDPATVQMEAQGGLKGN